MNKIERVSNEIRKRREELGYFQEDVVDKLKKEGVDISVSALSRIESMERQKLDTNLLIALSKVLKKDFIEMLGHNPEKHSSNISDEVFNSFIQIPLFGMASAGNGLIEYTDNIDEIEYISLPKLNGNIKKSDFATKVRGDSMEPYYHDGDIIVVDTGFFDIRTMNGKEGVVYYGEEKFLKKIFFEEGTGNLILKSYNPAYADIVIQNYELDKVICKGIISMVVSMRNRKRV